MKYTETTQSFPTVPYNHLSMTHMYTPTKATLPVCPIIPLSPQYTSAITVPSMYTDNAHIKHTYVLTTGTTIGHACTQIHTHIRTHPCQCQQFAFKV